MRLWEIHFFISFFKNETQKLLLKKTQKRFFSHITRNIKFFFSFFHSWKTILLTFLKKDKIYSTFAFTGKYALIFDSILYYFLLMLLIVIVKCIKWFMYLCGTHIKPRPHNSLVAAHTTQTHNHKMLKFQNEINYRIFSNENDIT